MKARGSIVTLIAAGALLTACPTRSRAEYASPADTTRMSLLRFALLNFDDVRVATGGRKLVTRSPIVSADGLMLIGDDDGSERRITTVRSETRMISWSEVESIEVRRGGSGVPILVGALAGVAIGTAIVLAQAFPLALSGREIDEGPVVIGFVGGAGLGALLGAPGRWKRVYP